jgi:hypothetical protein
MALDESWWIRNWRSCNKLVIYSGSPAGRSSDIIYTHTLMVDPVRHQHSGGSDKYTSLAWLVVTTIYIQLYSAYTHVLPFHSMWHTGHATGASTWARTCATVQAIQECGRYVPTDQSAPHNRIFCILALKQK